MACWCPYAQPVATPHRIVVLQHPREARRALGSVRILRRVLTDVVVRVGIELGDDPEVARSLADPDRDPVLLFPRPGPSGCDLSGRTRPVTLFALDGTWRQVTSLAAANPWLESLPHVRLTPDQPSVYGVCGQPGPDRLCTLEAVAHALAVVERDQEIREALVRPLRAMAKMHLSSIPPVRQAPAEG
jgi:DTW domain-containing protein